MQKRLLVIDGNSLLFRAFYAMPQLSNKDGLLTNAVFGFMNMFFKLLEDYTPQYVAIAFDTMGPTFRHLEFDEYKGNRQKTPEGLGHQFGMLYDLLETMPVSVYRHEGFEADDILAWLAEAATAQGIGTLLVTGDKDALQLVSHDVNVLLTKKGISQVQRFDPEELKREYGLEPLQIIELKALMGDNSDNIPGVPGVGEKTASSLIQQFGSVQGVYDHIEEVKGAKLKENLLKNKESAFLSKKLATIIKESPIQIDIGSSELKIKLSQELLNKLGVLGFQSLIDKFKFSFEEVAPKKIETVKKEFVQIDTPAKLLDIVRKINENETIAILAGDEFTVMTDESQLCKVDIPMVDALNILRPVLENIHIKKIAFDSKALMHLCKKFEISLNGIVFDPLIAAYLLDPAASRYSLKQIVYDYLKNDKENPDAEDLRLLFKELRVKLEERGMLKLYEEIEHPLIEVLFSIETAGFKVDREMLEKMAVEFSSALDKLTEQIYNFANGEFNINSPKQLGEILFNKLKLPAFKKTKTGYSTDIEVLEELKGRHPIVNALIDYRQISKLKSTYIEGLVKVIDPVDGRIHSSFNQTVAVTGRISSTDPNLQNIPVRMEMGRRIRKIFVPSDDHVLVDADYSQIELRILAHMSNDPDFIESFLSGEDIHSKTAAEMFGIDIDEVSVEQRSSAKAVNFGIVYGISDYGLSQNLGISLNSAKGYIDRYFTRYPKVREYFDEVVKNAEKSGYVTTLMGRRRDIPELLSKNKTIHSQGKRLAMNTPIQGTAADIIKKAMIDVNRELKQRNLRSKLILQVHDELIIDTHKEEIAEVKDLILDKMKNVVNLAVPLLVEVGEGANWYDAK